MGNPLTLSEKNAINARKVQLKREELYLDVLNGTLDLDHVKRLAQAYNLYNQYLQAFPSETREQRLKRLKNRGLVSPKEGLLLLEAAYLLTADPRLGSLLKKHATYEEPLGFREVEEQARRSLESSIEREQKERWFDDCEIPSELRNYVTTRPHYSKPFSCH